MRAPHPAIIDPDLLMLAYRDGLFPMADSREDAEVFWVEPRQRAILPLGGFHLSRSLARTLRRGRFSVTCNAAFGAVMDACAQPRRSDGGESWISHRIQASYERLHALGRAHSIECWQAGEDGDGDAGGERALRLVGGLYGVGFERVFCGESMFSRVPDASKVALAFLVAALRDAGACLLDCQFLTEHLASLGAVEISQQRYLELLRRAQAPALSGGGAEIDGGGGAAGAAPGGLSDGRSAGAAPALALPEAFAALVADAEASSSSPGKLIAQRLSQTS